MRAFMAVELDDEARAAVVAEQRRLASTIVGSGRGSLKWVRPEHLHLTLLFFRDVAEARVSALIEAMQANLEMAPFAIAFAGLGVFPQRGAPQVLWLGLSVGGPDVVALQRRMVARVNDLGIESDQRAFHPHLTLARWRRSHPADGPDAVAAAERGEVARMDVGRVALVRSELSANGPTHDVLAHATLTPCRSSSPPRT